MTIPIAKDVSISISANVMLTIITGFLFGAHIMIPLGLLVVGTGRYSSSGTPHQPQRPSGLDASPIVTYRYWWSTSLRCSLFQPCSPAGLLSPLTDKIVLENNPKWCATTPKETSALPSPGCLGTAPGGSCAARSQGRNPIAPGRKRLLPVGCHSRTVRYQM